MTATEFQHKLISNLDGMNRFAYKLTTNKDDAEDLVQETCFRALNFRDKFTNNTNFKAWSFTILKNIFINNYKQAKNKPNASNSSIEAYSQHYLRDSETYQPDVILASNEIERIIETLDEHYKTPFKMHQKGYKYKEIACILNMNIGTVKSRIFLTRKILIKKLHEYTS